MKTWLTSVDKKRHQRAINKVIHKTNKALEQDDLWLGRFVVRQIESPQWIRYSDNSGAELYITLKFIDRCTGKYYLKYESVNHWRWGNNWRLSEAMNWFIVEHCKVWNEELAILRQYDAWREYNRNVRVC